MLTETLLPFEFAYPIILGSCLIGFLFGIYNWLHVKSIDTEKRPADKNHILTAGSKRENGETIDHLDLMNKTSVLIQDVIFHIILGFIDISDERIPLSLDFPCCFLSYYLFHR